MACASAVSWIKLENRGHEYANGKVREMHLPRQNFAVFALQRRVFSRSNVGVIFIDKESMNYTPSEDPALPVYSAFNRNLGLEYNLASSNNLWTEKLWF
jgi:hypothetical protein